MAVASHGASTQTMEAYIRAERVTENKKRAERYVSPNENGNEIRTPPLHTHTHEKKRKGTEDVKAGKRRRRRRGV